MLHDIDNVFLAKKQQTKKMTRDCARSLTLFYYAVLMLAQLSYNKVRNKQTVLKSIMV